jgi:preprotein translocase subunit SecB
MANDLELLECEEGSKELSLGFEYFEMEPEDNEEDVCQGRMSVSLLSYATAEAGQTDDTAPAFRIEISLRGMFSGIFEESVSSEEKERTFSIYAVRTLYGLARTYVSIVTSLSPQGKIVLPEIDPEFVVDEERKR